MFPVRFGPLPRPQYALLLRTLSPWTRGLGPVRPVSFFTPQASFASPDADLPIFVHRPLPEPELPVPALFQTTPRFTVSAATPSTTRLRAISAASSASHPVSFNRPSSSMPVRSCPSSTTTV